MAWVSETDSILIKGKRGRFLKRKTGCLKRFDGVKLIRRKYISISEVISLSYTRSAKEIVTAIGIFDPADKNDDFTQTWQVLLHYGKSNFFEEKDYIDALFHILRGDAKTILIEFD